MRVIILIMGVWVAAAHGSFVSTQSATSQIDSGGVRRAEQSVGATDGFASSQAIWPAGVLPPAQGRTAARAGNTEIASNASFFETQFTVLAFDEILSQAFYGIQVTPDLLSVNAGVNFFLPPSYMEIVTNGESVFNELESVLIVDLRVCLAVACSSTDAVLHMQANAVSSFRNASYGLVLNADPALDVSGLANPVVTDTSNGFLRTYHVAFPEFTGHLDVGVVPVGQLLTVEYILQTRVRGIAQFNSAIAAINDPFTVDADPVRQGVPLSVTTSPADAGVPEPSTWLLLASAILPLCALRRSRQVGA